MIKQKLYSSAYLSNTSIVISCIYLFWFMHPFSKKEHLFFAGGHVSTHLKSTAGFRGNAWEELEIVSLPGSFF